MIEMVKCPVCGAEVSPEEYLAHYDSHAEGERRRPSETGVSREAEYLKKERERKVQYLRKNLDDMRSFSARRDFESMLKVGMEALVEVGRIYPSEVSWSAAGGAAIYNTIAISLLSAYKSDWDKAIKFVDTAIRYLD